MLAGTTRGRKKEPGAHDGSHRMQYQEARKHIEAQFRPGMTWASHGQWHIDHNHIRPCASFNLRVERNRRKCFHCPNFQPLWAFDNVSKGVSGPRRTRRIGSEGGPQHGGVPGN